MHQIYMYYLNMKVKQLEADYRLFNIINIIISII